MPFAIETSNLGSLILDFEYVNFEMPIRHSDEDINQEVGKSLEDEGRVMLWRDI